MSKNTIAIIGAGFAGLAVAWFCLRKGFSVTLFDERGIGGGASGMAAGLLHPYPGEVGRKSWRAEEAMIATRALIREAEEALGEAVVEKTGIMRRAWLDEQRQNFRSYSDVEEVSKELFFMRSGMTIDAPKYLEGLFKACKGVCLEKRKIGHIQELAAYSSVVIAAGAGSFAFAPIKASRTKGQVLLCRVQKFPEYSLIGKGYIALGKGSIVIGSTYEKGEISPLPCVETASNLLLPKALALLGEAPEILECRAGIRVSPTGDYRPIAKQIDARTYLMTGLGSRGLLYHALVARELAEQIVMR